MSPDNLLGRTSDREVVLTRILREKIIAFLSALVLFSSPIFAENSFSEQETLFLERFDQYVQDEIGDKVPGLAYAVVLDGKVAHLKTYGVKEIGKEDKIDQYTVFRIASVSKTFASTAAAVLVQKNILAWDSRVKPYLKDIDFRDKSYGQELRVHHLLSHSTGLVQHAYTNLINQNVKYSEIEKLIKKVKFVCKPGDCYGYQNVIYSLVGDIVEYLSGNKYEKFVSKYLFEPLQMNHASFGLNAFMENGNAAVPHKRKNDQWLAVKVKPNFYAVAPAAGVNASISDMSKWLLAQLGNSPEVLSQRILDDMHTRRIKTTKGQAHYGQWENLDTAYYGLGWRLFDYHGWTGFVHHGGWVQGFRTEMVFNPDLDMGMVILVNAQGVHVNNAVPAFIDLYMELGSDKLAQTKVDNRKDKSDN